ncbi:TIGR01777 family oxidoreductase [Zhouia sp. PK063]|uniref:TIGR01777 family oxidoreductase n=1 Tax=Zhouia sp. PK063 TaxID=3373602 RepID=UPI003798D8FF
MKILITGATGLVGSEIVKVCKAENIQVNYLTTRKSKIQHTENYQGFYWNPQKRNIDLKCFEGVDAVINLAGVPIAQRWTSKARKKILTSRVDALHILKEGIERLKGNHQIKSFVTASAIGIYPDSLTNLYNEAFEKVDDSFVGEVVKKWEAAANELGKFNFSLAKIRIGLVLSNKAGVLQEYAKPIKLGIGAPFGSGEQWQSWIHINDLAELFLFAIKHQLSGVFNGVAPNPITNETLTKKIAEALHKPLFMPKIPKALMFTVLGNMAYVIFSSQRVSAKKIEMKNFHFRYSNVSEALKDILQEKSQLSEKLA